MCKAKSMNKTRMMKDVAEELGLFWPRTLREDIRRGGPLPRQQRGEDGLHQWIENIGHGEVPKPASPPTMAFPQDWKPNENRVPPRKIGSHRGE